MKYLNLFLASLVVIFSSCGDDLDDNIVPVDENPIDNSGVTNYFPEKHCLVGDVNKLSQRKH